MTWAHIVADLFGGFFLTNALPHWLAGLMGQPFQSPFAKPPGRGLSSSTVNVLWGLFNLAVAYVLLVRVGALDVRSIQQVAAAGLGALAASLFSARHFGRLHGGDLPDRS
jgi:hypothetical protein